MNYLIIVNSEEAIAYAEPVLEAIQRHDVRASFYKPIGKTLAEHSEHSDFSTAFKTPSKEELKRRELDMVIFVGESFDRKLARRIKELDILNCFLLITASPDKGQKAFSQASQIFDQIFTDVPIYPECENSEQVGLYMSDVFRRSTFENEDELLTIGMLIDDKKNLKNFIDFSKSYSKKHSECRWIVGGKAYTGDGNEYFKRQNIIVQEDTFQLLKQANAVIVDNQRKSMEAALLNCPQVTVAGKAGFLVSTKQWLPVINQVTKQNLIKNILSTKKDLIEDELDLILNNHEYCAEVLSGYQLFKDRVGMQPVARNIAQKITEWLEEKVD